MRLVQIDINILWHFATSIRSMGWTSLRTADSGKGPSPWWAGVRRIWRCEWPFLFLVWAAQSCIPVNRPSQCPPAAATPRNPSTTVQKPCLISIFNVLLVIRNISYFRTVLEGSLQELKFTKCHYGSSPGNYGLYAKALLTNDPQPTAPLGSSSGTRDWVAGVGEMDEKQLLGFYTPS